MNTSPPPPRLSIIVTGGIGDIGGATGRRLARDGHRVTLVDLTPPDQAGATIAQWEDEEPALRGRLAYHRADVTSSVEVTAMVEVPLSFDAIVINAGTVRSAPFLEIAEDDWNRQLAVNLTGAFLCAQAAGRRMVREGTQGLLLFTGSWVAHVPWPEITAYTASKAGMESVARQAARELARHGIRSNVVSPGIVRAGLAKTQLDTEPQYAARAARVVPLGRLQTADQVAAAFSFLCSPDSEYMTGSTLTVDGGASLFAFD